MTDCSAGRDAASRSASSSSATAAVDALELGEEDERLGAQRADLASRRAGRSRSSGRASTRRRRDARGPRRARGDGARRARVRGVSRSACSASSAAAADAPRSAASLAASSSDGGDAGIRRVRRQREVTRAQRAGRRRSPAIRPCTLRRSSPRSGRATDDSSGCVKRIVPSSRSITCAATRRLERVRRDAGPLEQRLGRRAQRRGERERLARRAGSPAILARTSSSSVSGTGSGCERVDVGVERASQLQREERIAARPLVDPQQRLARERPAEPVAQEPMERARR